VLYTNEEALRVAVNALASKSVKLRNGLTTDLVLEMILKGVAEENLLPVFTLTGSYLRFTWTTGNSWSRSSRLAQLHTPGLS
jgi:hypothetical protein